MSLKTPASRFRVMLKKDPKWLRFKAVYDSAYKPEFDTYIDEIQLLHKTRSVRSLGVQSAPSGKTLADASMKDQSARSRCVELCINVVRSRNYLAITMNTVSSYLNAEHAEFMATLGVRTISDRRELVESMFGSAQRMLDKMDTITEIADLVIKDIDQGAWALKSTVSALEIATARERTV